jgi:hypothetical protein
MVIVKYGHSRLNYLYNKGMFSKIPPFPNRRAVQSELAKHFGRETASGLVRTAEERWRVLFPERPRVDSRVLQKFHLEGRILPALGLYQALLEGGTDRAEALDVMKGVLTLPLRSAKSGTRLLGRLPFFFPLFRFLLRMQMRRQFPDETWHTEWIEDSPRRIAFNTRACFYLGMLTRSGAPELTPVFCSTDDYLGEDMSPRMRWTRTQTLSRGGTCCDFCYERIDLK